MAAIKKTFYLIAFLAVVVVIGVVIWKNKPSGWLEDKSKNNTVTPVVTVPKDERKETQQQPVSGTPKDERKEAQPPPQVELVDLVRQSINDQLAANRSEGRCTRVTLTPDVNGNYYGVATFSDGSTLKIAVVANADDTYSWRSLENSEQDVKRLREAIGLAGTYLMTERFDRISANHAAETAHQFFQISQQTKNPYDLQITLDQNQKAKLAIAKAERSAAEAQASVEKVIRICNELNDPVAALHEIAQGRLAQDAQELVAELLSRYGNRVP